MLKSMGGSEGRIRRLPLVSGWTDGRDFPAPQGRTFRELYAARGRDRRGRA
jgi:L-lactate dehydrogenase complex protein LldF